MIRATAWLLAIVVLVALLTHGQAAATIQDESCIYPDVEYPLPCDDDD